MLYIYIYIHDQPFCPSLGTSCTKRPPGLIKALAVVGRIRLRINTASDNKDPFKRSVLISFTHCSLVFFQVNEWFNNNLISNPQEI